jgi:hypothetical protein
MKLQLAFILARTQIPLEWLQPPSKGDAEIATDEELFDDLECLYNTKLIAHFRDFGKELSVAEAKSLKISINPIWKIPASCHYVQLFFILTPSPYRSWYFSKHQFCQRKPGGNICECFRECRIWE